MKEIIIGKEGNQPFQFTPIQTRVSRRHARLVLNDNGLMVLEDLDSSNGTFVRNEAGDFMRISQVTVKEDTYICLGPNDASGCKFYVRQLFTPGSYSSDFQQLDDIRERLSEEDEKIDKTSRNIRILVAYVSLATLFGSFVLPDVIHIAGNDIKLQMLCLRIGTIVSIFSSAFYNPMKAKKETANKRKKYYICPNPQCSKRLSEGEIEDRRCMKCGAQG